MLASRLDRQSLGQGVTTAPIALSANRRAPAFIECLKKSIVSTADSYESPSEHGSLQAERQAVIAAFAALAEPLATLCVSKAVNIQAVEEILRQAFVRAAKQHCSDANPERLTSRISTMTGLTRREVARLELIPPRQLPQTRSPATDLVTHWLSLPGYTDDRGKSRTIPRLGASPSFEALAASVTRDVHPRTLLAELMRLQMVKYDAALDTMTLLEKAFVPRSDFTRMLGFLGVNVGDHLSAAVTNVLGTGSEHFEQALLADELSPESVQRARKLVTDQWTSLLTTLGPQLQALMDEDVFCKRAQTQAVRIGLYSWSAPMPATSSQNGSSESEVKDPQ